MDNNNDDFNNRYEVEHKTAFEGNTESYRMNLSVIKMTDSIILDGLNEIIQEVTHILMNRLENLPKHGRIIATITVEGAMNEYDYTVFVFNATIKLLQPVTGVFDLREYVSTRVVRAQQKINSEYDNFKNQNKADKHLLYFFLHIHKFTDIQSNDRSLEKSLLAAIHPNVNESKALETFSTYIDLEDIDDHVTLDDISSIENKNDISINVYMSKQEKVEGPLYFTKKRKNKHIDLLWSCESEDNHFSYIKNTERGNNRCDGCWNVFKSKNDLSLHKHECLRVTTSIPDTRTIKFDNKDRVNKVPFVVYADIEMAVKPLYQNTLENMPNDNWTTNTKKHVPYRYGYYIKCDDDNFSLPYKTSVNTDLSHIVSEFTSNLVRDLSTKIDEFRKKHPKADIKTVPVIMHDLKREKSCFIAQGSSCQSMFKNYSAIHKTVKTECGKEVFELRFLESRGFLDDSLQDSVKNLKIRFQEIEKMCNAMNGDDNNDLYNSLINAIKQGGFPFPRDYIESPENLIENYFPQPTVNDGFLISENMTNVQHQVGNHLWRIFNCQNINDYLGCRLKANILILADIIEYIRQLCISNYDLDPAHYFSIAGLSWDAMLKSTNIELHLLPDVEMLLFIKKAIRGGYIQCNKRLATANNELSNHDLSKEESNIMFYDVNNLYGHVMCQYLPYGGFEWADTNIDWQVGEKSDVGYILEVDLSFPDTLHNLHSDFPFFPIKRNVDGNDYKLLVADLEIRERYIVHYLYLELFLNQGGKIEKTHRILKFNQKPWLREYIKKNIKKRGAATTESEKKIFKLMNNSIFGKTMQNVENQGKILLLNNWEDAARYVQRPDFHSLSICSQNAVAIKLRHTNLIFKYPIYIGFCILDLSKAVMYNFHYGVMKNIFEDNITLLYTDTDSLVYEFKGDSYKLMEREDIKKYFDEEKYAEDNFDNLYSVCFKDEMNRKRIEEFVCLKSKVYAVKTESGIKMKSPHLPSYVKDTLSVDDYKDCLQSMNPLYKKYNRIRALDHDVYTQTVSRIAISPNEKKRYIKDNNIDTLPWGHFEIPVEHK